MRRLPLPAFLVMLAAPALAQADGRPIPRGVVPSGRPVIGTPTISATLPIERTITTAALVVTGIRDTAGPIDRTVVTPKLIVTGIR